MNKALKSRVIPLGEVERWRDGMSGGAAKESLIYR
jgi:hypothetical protein